MLNELVASPLGGAVVAALIGLLLGLEREHSQRGDGGLFAGIRTFPILTQCGFVAARAAGFGLSWALATTLLAVGGLAIASYTRGAHVHVGATTEVVAMLAPLLGAMVAWGEGVLAASVALLVTFLLTMTAALHRLAGAVTEEEILAILKFGLVALILVPLLPARGFGPYSALVPRQIGLVVVVLSAVSLGGYLLVRTLGPRVGWTLAGLMGGLASSTAVTLSFSARARDDASQIRPLAIGILLASTVLYLRTLLLLGFFDSALALYLLPRMVALVVCGAAFALVAYRRLDGASSAGMQLKNPAELGKAVTLGLLFSAILLGARSAQAHLGAAGVWATGALGGLLDVDSVSVAMADLRLKGLAPMEAAGGTVLLATLANLVLKAGLVVTIGGATLARRLAPAVASLAFLTLALLVLDIWVY